MGILLTIREGRISRRVLDQTAEIIRSGGVIIYPTDTIYGLGCNALERRAVEKVFDIKRRPGWNPALVLVRTVSMLKELAEEVPPLALPLMREFWPGPLTLLLPARKGLHSFIVSSEGKIAIRIPASRFCLRLIGVSGLPLLSTSVNLSGKDPLTQVAAIREEFMGRVDALVDAGDIGGSLPSTVLDATGGELQLVREGAISARRIRTIAGSPKKAHYRRLRSGVRRSN
jgi:L-threonylcarbamoyladenylate synthase